MRVCRLPCRAFGTSAGWTLRVKMRGLGALGLLAVAGLCQIAYGQPPDNPVIGTVYGDLTRLPPVVLPTGAEIPVPSGGDALVPIPAPPPAAPLTHCPECGRPWNGQPWDGSTGVPPGAPRGEAGPFGKMVSPPPQLDNSPLLMESWLHRPFGFSSFSGMVYGSPLVDDWLREEEGFLGGYRLSWDSDCYWGVETRFAFGNAELHDSARAMAAQHAADDAAGLAADDPWRHRFDRRRDADLIYWDVDLLFYPFGDAPLRPYVELGAGVAHLRFNDRLSNCYSTTLLSLPVALGVKYRVTPWLALRLEGADNITFGSRSDLNTIHNIAFVVGAEFRFGGPRTAYWPWDPGKHYW